LAMSCSLLLNIANNSKDPYSIRICMRDVWHTPKK
jgi:hypothetical protein